MASESKSLFGSAPVVQPGPHALANAAAAAANPAPPPIDASRFVVVYPVYINAEVSLADGRKVRKDQGVANPTSQEFYEASKMLAMLGYAVVFEVKKRHPKDFFTYGRLRVQLKKDGALVGPLKNREELYVEMAKLVGQVKVKIAAAVAAQAAAAAGTGSSSSSSSSGGAIAGSSASATQAAGASSNSPSGGSGGNNKKKKGKK